MKAVFSSTADLSVVKADIIRHSHKSEGPTSRTGSEKAASVFVKGTVLKGALPEHIRCPTIRLTTYNAECVCACFVFHKNTKG